MARLPSRWIANLLCVVAVTILFGPVSGCDDNESYPPTGRQRLQGFVIVGHEVWGFQQCGSSLIISVDIQGNEPGIEKLGPHLAACPGSSCPLQAVYVELDAVVSDQCPCGHVGAYERELAIKEVLAASRTPPPSCVHAPPKFPQ